ncbi:MAG: GGDEF domain-containing protein, partial [Gordonibacter urolithinfaciens]
MLYVVGDTMRYAFPESDFGDMAGRDLTQLTYVFTLAKWIDGFVVEGPVTLANGEESFVFLEPVDVDGAYHGEVAVALKADYVIEQLGLSQLEQDG